MRSVEPITPVQAHPLHDPQVRVLLTNMPKGVADSFSTEQLLALKQALAHRTWGRKGERHSLDLRTSLSLPFTPLRFYMVFLLGRERRTLNQQERVIAVIALLLVLMIGGLMCVSLLLVMLYFVKSWLGIDLFENFSLGVWRNG